MEKIRLKEHFEEILSSIMAYEPPEAREILFLVFEKIYGIKKNDFVINDFFLPLKDNEIDQIIKRLNLNEPIQYILGEAWFCEYKFYVNENVLIPRPETEELISHIVNQKPKSILDLGTGSGCIAISCAKILKNAEVYAVDISEKALEIAKKNNLNLEAKVKLSIADILDFHNPFGKIKFDMIVSNPPYVKDSEQKEMRKNVLDFEPFLALFVADNDPLIFYRKIAEIGLTHLKPKGKIIVEINSALGIETCQIFENYGYQNVILINDFLGRNRFVFGEFLG